MMIKKRYVLGFVFILFFNSVVLGQGPQGFQFEEAMTKGTHISISNARIMQINIADNKMIIAEKELVLPIYRDKKGHIHYQTQFRGVDAKKIAIGDFKLGDRVNVDGVWLPRGIFVANSITLVSR